MPSPTEIADETFADCEHCGDPIDYCQGHGHWADHEACDPEDCEVAADRYVVAAEADDQRRIDAGEWGLAWL